MKKFIKMTFNFLLVLTLFITSMNSVIAENDTVGNDAISVSVSQNYNESENKETVQLIVIPAEGVELVKLIYPDLTEGDDLGNYSYEVTTNQNSTFKVVYKEGEAEMEYEVKVNTTSIQMAEKVEEVVPLLVPVTDGSVTVTIADYDPAIGWKNGIVYEVIITVNFNETTSTGKKIKISLLEGMNYANYPVLGTPRVNTPEYAMQTPTNMFVDRVTVPSKQIYYPSYNGDLIYEIKSNASAIELKVNIAVDKNLYNGPKTIFDGIVVSAEKEGISIGQVNTDVEAIGSFNMDSYSNNWQSLIQVGKDDMSTFNLPHSYITMNSDYPGQAIYAKQIDWYFHYPVGFEGVSSSSGTVVEINDTNGYMHAQWTNQYGYYLGGFPALKMKQTAGLPTGTYTASETYKYVITFYDDTTLEVINPRSYIRPIKIEVVDSVPNKLSLTAQNRSFYSPSDDYYGNAGFLLKNDQLAVRTEQWLEYTINPNFEVIQITFPNNLSTVTDVEYITSANPSEVKTTTAVVIDNSIYRAITKDSLGLADGEYIIYAKAKLGNFAKEYNSGGLLAHDNQIHVVGKLTAGINSAAVTMETFAYEADGVTKDPDSISTVTSTITRVATPSYGMATQANSISVIAGEAAAISIDFVPNVTGNVLGVVNPTVYLKVIDGITFKNFAVTQDGTDVLKEVMGPYAVGNDYYYAIKTNVKIGSFFDGNKKHKITLTYDIVTDKTTTGVYQWKDLGFVGIDGIIMSPVVNGSAIVSDIIDVNQNGNTAERLSTIKGTTITVLPLKELIIDTYIVPSGEERKPGYDASSETSKQATAVGFTPVTTGEYNVIMLNNRDTNVNKVITYIPVPKTGYNFGTDYQGAAFAWDMKLNGNPEVKVAVNGVEDSSKKSNYVIEYATVANGGNPELASYTNSITTSTNMIRVTNTAGIEPQEEAKFLFTYEVNESSASVAANPEKLGSINDFMPYYYFEAGSAGYQNGTRVGAILQIGVISGQVWVDKDYDGIKNNSDTWLTSGTVKLIKADGSIAGTSTLSATGEYLFANLAAGTYKLDFSGVLNSSNYQYYTFKNQTGTVNSAVEQSGSNTGFVVNVDPTQESSKVINAGILEYNPADITVNGSNVTVRAANSQTSGSSAAITTTINNSNFDKLKAINGAYSYISNGTAIATVNSNGVVTGIAVGSTTVTIKVTDIFGNVKTGNSNITVTSNTIPEITFTTNPLVLNVGDSYNELAGVSVSDVEDGTGLTTADLVITGDAVSTAAADIYVVTYAVTDNHGNVTTKDRVVVVNDGTIVIKDEYIFKGTNFAIVSEDVNTTDKKTQIVSKSGANVYNKMTGQEVAYDLDAGGYTNIEGVYTITINPTAKPTEKHSFKALVFEGNVVIGDKYIIEANPITIGVTQAKDITNDDLIRYTEAKVTEISTGLEKSNGVEVVSHTVKAIVGEYQVSFRVKAEPTTVITVKVTVRPEDEVIIGDYYGIAANHIVIGLDGATELIASDSKLITRTKAVAWKLDDESEATVKVDSKTIGTTVGIYTVTFSVLEEPTTKITVNVEVFPRGIVVEGKEYAIAANDFVIGQGEEITSEMLINKSQVIAWNKETLANAEVEMESHTILAETGLYTVIFRVKDEPSTKITVKVEVKADDIVIEGNEYAIGASHIEIMQKEVAGLTDEDLIALGLAHAWKKADRSKATVEVVAHTIKEKVGIYTVTYRVKEEITTIITVNVNVIKTAMYYIEASHFTIHYNDLQNHINNNVLANKVIELSCAHAWVDGHYEGIVSLPVYVKDITPLTNAAVGEKVQLELVLIKNTGVASRLLTDDLVNITHPIKVEVIATPVSVAKDNIPSTGVKQSVHFFASIGVIITGMLLVLVKKMKKEEN